MVKFRDQFLVLQSDSSLHYKQPCVAFRTGHVVRAFILWALQFKVLVHARHVPGLENRIADVLSRQRMDLFWEVGPGAGEFPGVLPLEVWQIGERMHQER